MNNEYLSCLRFGDDGDFYYLKDNNEEVLELYNPTNATRFSCSEDAINFAIQKTSMGGYARAITIEEAFEEWNKFTDPDNARRTFKKVNESFSRKYDSEKDDPLDVLKMRLAMHENDKSVRYEDYKTWPQLYSLYEHIFNTTHFEDGSVSFSMKIDGTDRILAKGKQKKTFNIKVFQEELKIILPFITHKEDDYCIIDIFDHFLSENGNSCCFYYKNDDDCFIKGRWVDKIGSNLESCLLYWQKKRYYD
jgi:hypothetical protein